MRALTYYVAASLDGFIAGPEHQIDAFEVEPDLIGHIIDHYPETLPAPARSALGIAEVPNRRFGTVVMGRRTYEVGLNEGLTSPYGHLDQIVMSSGLQRDLDPDVTITTEDPVTVVENLKAGGGLGIWLCGGGLLAGTLIDHVDELVVKRFPVALGAGRPLFDGPYQPRRFELIERREIGHVWLETYRPRELVHPPADSARSLDGAR